MVLISLSMYTNIQLIVSLIGLQIDATELGEAMLSPPAYVEAVLNNTFI